MESVSTFLNQYWLFVFLLFSVGLSYLVVKVWYGRLGIYFRLKIMETKDYMISIKTNDKKNILLDVKNKEKISLRIYNTETGFPTNELHLNKRDLEYLLKFINSSKNVINIEHETV